MFCVIKRIIKDKLWDLENRIHAFRYGYPKWAKWNIDDWFLKSIIPMLDSMIKDGCSCPGNFVREEDHENPFEDWRKVLQEMKEGFEEYLYNREFKNWDRLEQKHGKSTDKFWEEVRKEEKIAIEKLYKSLDLFKKHFWDLWD